MTVSFSVIHEYKARSSSRRLPYPHLPSHHHETGTVLGRGITVEYK